MQTLPTPALTPPLRGQEDLLERSSPFPSSSLSPLQSQVDGLLSGFTAQATDWRSLAAMTAGGLAYRAGRIGLMGLGNGSVLRAASVGLGLTAEVSTFELSHRALESLNPPNPPLSKGGEGGFSNLWRWNGNGGIRQGLLQSFVTFGALKGAGRLARSENLIARHLFQDSAMVVSHQVTGALGIAPRPEGSLVEQFLHAEATNLQIGAGMALAGRMAPGLQALERGLDLSLRPSVKIRPLDPFIRTPALAAASLGSKGLAADPSRSGPEGLRDQQMLTVQYDEEVLGVSENSWDPVEGIRVPSRGGVMVRTCEGWIQLGVPMWTNKDAVRLYFDPANKNLPVSERLPTTYILDLDYCPPTDGLLPADFIQYMHFLTEGTTFTLVAPDRSTARRLKNFLNLSYEGPDSPDLNRDVKREYPLGGIGLPDMAREIDEGFPASSTEVLRQVRFFTPQGIFRKGSLEVRKLGPLLYELKEPGRVQRIDLKNYPLPSPSFVEDPLPLEAEGIRQKVLEECRPGIWPIGTAHGFSPDEETSGFMIWNRGKTVLVDPPSSTLRFLKRHRIPLSAVDGVLLSHGHTDHYGNAVPQLLETLPRLNLYTTPTILKMLSRQYRWAIDSTKHHLEDWNFVPLRPQSFSNILGLHLRPEYSFHPVPALGFEIYDRPDAQNGRLVLLFTGDTFADHVDIWKQVKREGRSENGVMKVERALQILRHIELLYSTRGQLPPPTMLIEGGIPPIHTPPLRTREILDRAFQEGVDTSRVRVYHISDKDAAKAAVPKWKAGHEGFIDLSDYF